MRSFIAGVTGASALMHIHHRHYSKHSSNQHDAMLGRIEEHVQAKAATTSNHEALNLVGKKLNTEQRSQLQMMLMTGASANATLAAMKTLNALFLEIEKQLTARTIECMDKYDYWQGQVDSHESTKKALDTLATEKTDASAQQRNEIGQAQEDLQDLRDTMARELGAKQKIIDEEVAILKEREAEMNEYAAIISFVDIACNSSGSSGFLQYSKTADKDSCGTCLPGQTTEEAINLLLSRPEFQTKLNTLQTDVRAGVEREMSSMGMKTGQDSDEDQEFLEKEKDTGAPDFESRDSTDSITDDVNEDDEADIAEPVAETENTQKDDEEEGADASSFLQMTQPLHEHPSGLYKYCDGSCQGETPCTYLETLFGEELACRQRAFEEQSRIVNELRDEYAKDEAKHNERIQDQNKMISSMEEVI